MSFRKFCIATAMLLLFVGAPPNLLHAFSNETLQSVVSVLPIRPGLAQGGVVQDSGGAPEGSGIVLEPGLIATAWHVVDAAIEIDVRLSDGRVIPARLIAKDVASDIALLGVETALSPFEIATAPGLAQRVCAIGNAYGLGLSVTCGVISALTVTDAGFNSVEDFVQTDAAANPGASGGALVDEDGRLVGMMSAIFASEGDTNIGVNFATSTDLLLRVSAELISDGEVEYFSPGWNLEMPRRDQLATLAAPAVVEVTDSSPADAAGIERGDRILNVGSRRVRTPRDALAALAIVPNTSSALEITLRRDGKNRIVSLTLDASSIEIDAPETPEACPYPASVCLVRQAVFPISSFDPTASATRIGPTFLVTNRHVLADRSNAIVHLPAGPMNAALVPSAFLGDLVLLEVQGLPEKGIIPNLAGELTGEGQFYAVGVDISRQEVRVFEPGGLIEMPAEGAALGRLHVSSHMQPGVSGGALVDERGELAGIAVGGGSGRFEAMSLDSVRSLLAMRMAPDATVVTRRQGIALAACEAKMDKVQLGDAGELELDELVKICAASMNHGQLLEAGRILARAGDFDGAIALHGQAAEQVPNSINARISLLVSLQLAGRFKEMTGHASMLMQMDPEDPQVLRFAIQSGVWGNAPALAEEAYQALRKADPRQAVAARRFIDNAPPAPMIR